MPYQLIFKCPEIRMDLSKSDGLSHTHMHTHTLAGTHTDKDSDCPGNQQLQQRICIVFQQEMAM